MNYRKYKFYTFIKKNLIILVVISLTALVISCYALYMFSKPEIVKSEVSVPFYSIKAGWDGYATVEYENPIWNVGVTLRDRPIYISSVAPNLTLSFEFGIFGQNISDVQISKNTRVILSSKFGEKYVWSKVYLKRMKEANSSFIRDEFSLNVEDIMNELISISKELGYRGKENVEVVTVVNFSGKSDGLTFEGSRTYILPINVNANTYSFNSFNRTENIQRVVYSYIESQPMSLNKVISAVAVLVSAAFLIGFTTIALRFRPEMYDIETLKLEEEKKKIWQVDQFRNSKDIGI